MKDITVNQISNKVFDLDISPNDLIFKNGFAINLDLKSSAVIDPTMRLFQPFRIVESRVSRILEGKIIYRINLIEHSFSKGDIFVIKQNSLCEVVEISTDCRMQMVALGYETINLNSKSQNRTLWKIQPKENDWDEIGALYDIIYNIARHEPFRVETVTNLVGALIYNILSIADFAESNSSSGQKSRKKELFNKFIDILNANSSGKQDIAFYANKIRITPHYLSRIVSEVSGQSVMQWINKAVVLETKIKLKNSNLTISEIAEELNFENLSFFSRFFKRETDMTPSQYRNS